MPIAVKDLTATKGMRTTFGSRIFADFVPEEDSYVVERMRAAGAIIIGKTNVPEFGLGSQTYNEVFGATRNAFDQRLTSGGSSGGAAVALALDMLPVADGSDMCGSLRNPAGWNNIFGFRTSPGRVPSGRRTSSSCRRWASRARWRAMSRDLALLLAVQAGYDARSPLSLAEPFAWLPSERPSEHVWRVAWLGDLGWLPADGSRASSMFAKQHSDGAPTGVPRRGLRSRIRPRWAVARFVTFRHATGGAALKVHYDNPGQRELLKPEAVWEIEGGLSLTAPDIYAPRPCGRIGTRPCRRCSTASTCWYCRTAQVFAFDVGEHWPAEIEGRRMDSYHRWMEVTSLATMAGCPAIAVPAGFDEQGKGDGVAAHRPAARRRRGAQRRRRLRGGLRDQAWHLTAISAPAAVPDSRARSAG